MNFVEGAAGGGASETVSLGSVERFESPLRVRGDISSKGT